MFKYIASLNCLYLNYNDKYDINLDTVYIVVNGNG